MSENTQRFLVVAVVLAALAFVGFVVFDAEEETAGPVTPTPPPRVGGGSGPSYNLGGGSRVGDVATTGHGQSMSTKQSLEYRLWLYAKSDAIKQAQIVHSIREELDLFKGRLTEILKDDGQNEELIPAAAAVCGRLGLREVIAEISALLDHARPQVRIAAIQALSQLGDWTRESIRILLTSERNVDCLIVALEACALLKSPPVDAIIGLCVHKDHGVIRAAYRAMPSTLSQEDLDFMVGFIRSSADDKDTAVAVAKILAAVDQGQLRDRALVDLLEMDNWGVQEICLTALSRDNSKIYDDKSVWRIIENPKSSSSVKVRAFHALERSGKVDVARIKQVEAQQHPVVRLIAARCLVTVGDKDGLRILIDLLSTVESENVDDEDRDCARSGAHKILKEVSSRDFARKQEEWTRWYGEVEKLQPRTLQTRVELNW